MASIEKIIRKNGTSWKVYWRDLSGKQMTKTFQRRGLAYDYMVKVENDIRQGVFVAPNVITVGEYIDSWIETHKSSIAANTYKSYLSPIKHIKKHLGKKPLQKLLPNDIKKMYTSLSGKVSNTFINYIHRVLNTALKAAVLQRLLNHNPCSFVKPPKREKSSAKIIQPEEVKIYLAAFKDHYLYIAVSLAIFCGLRNSEVLGLMWSDINWEKSTLTVSHSLYWPSSKEYEIVPTKNRQSRIVPLTASMIADLKAQKEWQNENKQLYWNKYNKSDFVFTRPDGSLLNTRLLSKYFSRVLEAKNLEHIRFHDLRHTCASLMLLEGESLKSISDILGHSTIKITADTYVHIVEDLKRQAVSKLDKYRGL